MADAAHRREVIPLFPLGTPLFPGVVLPLEVFEPRYRTLVAELRALPDGPGRRFGVVAIRQGWEVEEIAPAAALYDVGCTAVLRVVAQRADGGFRVVTVGADRFRLLEVLVPDGEDDPPYLRARVEWLGDEEAAEEAAGDAEGLVPTGGAAGGVPEEVVTEVARGSLEVLTANVRELFARYVAAVAARQAGGDPAALPEEVLEALEPDSPADDQGPDATADLLREVSEDARGLSYLVASAAMLTTEDRQALLAESATRRRLALESRLLRRELTLLETIGAVPVPLAQFATAMTSN
jgi:hypothetical protein